MRAPASVATLPGRTVAFGPFTFDRASRLLWKDGVEIPLPPRVIGVLALLIERSGELVTKQELMSAVWRDAFVTETSLAEAISVLRQTLGDDSQRPTYIQTLHRRGYRFIASVQDAAEPTAAAAATLQPSVPPASEPRLGLLVPWIVALFALLTAAAAVWQHVERGASQPRRPVRFALSLPAGLTVSPAGGAVAVSPDGALIAFAACHGDDCAIHVRPLSQSDSTPVAGTAGGASPFFSPDGRSLGYFAGGLLKTIALAGGAPVTAADASEPLGAAWLDDGRIVFARAASEGLFVASASRRVQRFTSPGQGEQGHRWPSVLPDGSGVLFTVAGGSRGDQQYAALASLRTGEWSRLLDGVAGARVPIPGYLLAQRGTDLVAAAFDSRAPAVVGLPVAAGSIGAAATGSNFAMSRSGTLVIAPPGSSVMHVVLDWSDELRRVVPALEPTLPR